MWKSRLFWKLFVAYAGIYLLSAIAIVILVSNWHEKVIVDQVATRLRETAIVVRSQIADQFNVPVSNELQQKIRQLGQETGTRITIVDLDGKVRADSEQDSLAAVLEMGNHKNRSELAQAVESGAGVSKRQSPTLDLPMLYSAIRVDNAGQAVGLVRTASPMSFIRDQIQHVQRLVFTIFFLVTVSVVAITYWVVTQLISPVDALRRAGDAISEGDYDTHVHLDRRDELGQLGVAFNDMSQQLRNQVSQLRLSQERITMILDAIGEGIIALDGDGKISFANPMAGEQFGFSPKLAKGQELFLTVRQAELKASVDDARSTKTSQATEFTVPDSKLTFEVTASPIPGNPPNGIVVVSRDITELRRLDGVRREFVANVSHEFNTPITNIRLYAETLRNGAIEDVANRDRFVKQIEEQAANLQQLVADVIALTRAESPKTSFEIHRISLNEVIDDRIAHFEKTAADKDIRVKADIAEDAVVVDANEESIVQILDHLLDNAVRYTPEGGEITVSCSANQSMAVLEVADTGVGIPVEHRSRIFERFYRVDKARSRRTGGTGLGLSIVRHLVSLFDGQIKVESNSPQGTTFIVTIPLAGDTSNALLGDD
ncbi:MAG: HAMP domain-containing protein [Planctomycetales bacterium]|nr:HAMP domain-containing protein [Planctomycetales bacterium]